MPWWIIDLTNFMSFNTGFSIIMYAWLVVAPFIVIIGSISGIKGFH